MTVYSHDKPVPVSKMAHYLKEECFNCGTWFSAKEKKCTQCGMTNLDRFDKEAANRAHFVHKMASKNKEKSI